MDDEVLNEIKRVGKELTAIAEYNRDELKALHAAAKEEMKRLEIKRKLDVIDQEVIHLMIYILLIQICFSILTSYFRIFSLHSDH